MGEAEAAPFQWLEEEVGEDLGFESEMRHGSNPNLIEGVGSEPTEPRLTRAGKALVNFGKSVYNKIPGAEKVLDTAGKVAFGLATARSIGKDVKGIVNDIKGPQAVPVISPSNDHTFGTLDRQPTELFINVRGGGAPPDYHQPIIHPKRRRSHRKHHRKRR